MSITRQEIIALAACPFCCASIGTACVFAPCDDPERKREAAQISHGPRVILARKKYETLLDSIF